MRRIRARRRFRAGLIIALALSLVLFLESKIEALVPQIRNAAGLNIEKALGAGTRLTIGTIDGGIIHPITLGDVIITNDKNSGVMPSRVTADINTNYRLWDILFRMRRIARSQGILPGSRIGISFAMDDRRLSGLVMLEGGEDGSKLSGYLQLGEEKLGLSGSIGRGSFSILAIPRRGAIKVTGEVSQDEELSMSFRASHIKINGMDVSFDALLKNSRVAPSSGSGKSVLVGEVEAKNFILNYRPFLDTKGSYRISDDMLDTDMSFGDNIRLIGSVLLKDPYNCDMKLTINNTSINWLLISLGNKDSSSVLSGTLNGKLEIRGPAMSPVSNFSMDIRKGAIGGLEFDTLNAVLKGDGPVLRIEDSRITRQSGYFTLAGEIDLKKIGKASVFDDIKLTSDERAILWDGMDSLSAKGVQEVRMTKRINDDINLDFKKFVADQGVGESVRDKDDVKLEYKLQQNDSLKLMLGKDKDFVGLEHKDKF